jgi:multiple antibiotic resistance protein
MNLSAILSVSFILFSVIDILGSLPAILDMKKNGLEIKARIATLAAALIMMAFLFFGNAILGLFHIEIASFALAGSLIIFFIGLEMLLGIRIFRDNQSTGSSGSIVPIAFPLLAGAGTLTTIISLKADYDTISIASGILINLVIIYLTLSSTDWLSRKMSPQVTATLRKTFGILLLAIAIQMFRTYA